MEQTSRIRIKTEKASRYLQQVCKHFAHKIPVTHTPVKGAVEIQFGKFEFAVAEGHLTMIVTARDKESLEKVQMVIIKHLDRFAFKEILEYEWQQNIS